MSDYTLDDAVATFGQMIVQGLEIQAHKKSREDYEARLRGLFERFSKEEMRVMWDHIGDDSFFGPYDCADIHGWMNLQGDGGYCAV